MESGTQKILAAGIIIIVFAIIVINSGGGNPPDNGDSTQTDGFINELTPLPSYTEFTVQNGLNATFINNGEKTIKIKAYSTLDENGETCTCDATKNLHNCNADFRRKAPTYPDLMVPIQPDEHITLNCRKAGETRYTEGQQYRLKTEIKYMIEGDEREKKTRGSLAGQISNPS